MVNRVSPLSFKNPWYFIAIGFGSGLSPVIPGTVGTLSAIPFYLLLVQLPVSIYIVVVFFSCLAAVGICQAASDDLGVRDHSSIVLDEFVGFWITMLVVPVFNVSVMDWKWILTGFSLFRFFDILKPWPIGWFDKYVNGGLGVVLDDVIAGIIAGSVLWIIGRCAGWV
ncbi:phosphatidylglycerophosphatase A [Candidatus Photodesmus blepharus]|uniref:Phosphatidylglycerophosphatase A n=1 Tax=Candidatus Photodesmus blepharonis TaxID=1179155 RepID=A0A084CNX2_9GAMM|nr:phosphatidylglycerophosphatase A [Candidatus Photodesmus blepharus]KEY91501.1 phosphatidylglycerophosphatase A [Candidatus Photodesmus blepharus]